MGLTWGILGSGFGAYGYVPALIRAGHLVLIPEANRNKLASRHDLKPFFSSIRFLPEKDLIKLASNLVIARRPIDQREIIENNLSLLRSKSLFLEKPLAETNAHSIELLNMLKENAISFRIGFLASYSEWMSRLKETVLKHKREQIQIELSWKFNASHFKNGDFLKIGRQVQFLGGGCFNFYGSHVLHALAQLGEWQVYDFKRNYMASNMDTAFEIGLVADSLKANILLDSNSDSPSAFQISVFSKSDCLYQYCDNSLLPMPKDYQTVDPGQT